MLLDEKSLYSQRHIDESWQKIADILFVARLGVDQSGIFSVHLLLQYGTKAEIQAISKECSEARRIFLCGGE